MSPANCGQEFIYGMGGGALSLLALATLLAFIISLLTRSNEEPEVKNPWTYYPKFSDQMLDGMVDMPLPAQDVPRLVLEIRALRLALDAARSREEALLKENAELKEKKNDAA